MIEENISYWLAVEQDIIDSYTKLANQSEDKMVKLTLTQIVQDSRNHILMLTSMQKTFHKILEDEERHAKLLQELADRAHK